MSLRAGLIAAVISLPCFASNSDSGQPNAEEQILPKLNLLCGGTFISKYDLASLKANNKDIGWDQTSGHLECDEPLRLIWALCQSAEGKALVRRNELREVRCRGIAGNVGKLSVKSGVITVERAYEEREAWKRAHTEFEAALKVKVPLKSPDPYYDDAWRDFLQAPTPVTSTTDYCLVNGEKVKLDLSWGERTQEGTVKCLERGVVVVDLTLKDGRKTGLSRATRDDWYRVEHAIDGKRDGVVEEFRKGTLTRRELYKAGQRVWTREFNERGEVKEYTRQFANGQVTLRLTDDGRVTSLNCLPEARGDDVVDAWCGFKGDRVVSIYDGTEKVSAIRTFRNGVVVREQPGDSHYAARRDVAFDANGKKQGEERITREDGTLARIARWKSGEQEGAEEVFAKDGQRVVERTLWKGGAPIDHTEFFLNGNPKQREANDGDRQSRITWFDLGAKQSEAQFARCSNGRGWCEDGTSRRWFENGKLAEESRWTLGVQDGVTKRWFPSGTQQLEERWDKGLRRARREWDEKGTLLADDEFEDDGSRKLRR